MPGEGRSGCRADPVAAGAGYPLVEARPGVKSRLRRGRRPRVGSDRMFVCSWRPDPSGTPVLRRVSSSTSPPADAAGRDRERARRPPQHGDSAGLREVGAFLRALRHRDRPAVQPLPLDRGGIASAEPRVVADPASGEILLSLQKPHPVHFGGGLCFGPDGMLYVGFGDKAVPNDTERVAQSMNVLDGKILRLDVAVRLRRRRRSRGRRARRPCARRSRHGSPCANVVRPRVGAWPGVTWPDEAR